MARLARVSHTMNAKIAGIASVYGLTLATRNVKDCEGLGIDIIDP